MHDEYTVSLQSAKELLWAGKVFPIFDGLDELCADDSDVEPAVQLLRSLIDWRITANWAKFFLACRRNVWDRINAELAGHHTLTVFSITAVGRHEAYEYLKNSVRSTAQGTVAGELIRSLQAKGHGYLLTTPWQLNLLAEISRRRLNQSGGMDVADLDQITNFATVDNLIAYYVESAQRKSRNIFSRVRRSLDYWWLSKYAKYLEENNSRSRKLDGQTLPARDLVLHRLWPIAGGAAPRLVDLAMCIVASAPGFFWLAVFFRHRGLLPDILLFVFGFIWLALLVRTSTKPWVRSAAPNWSRLSNPKFFVPQLVAAFIIGVTLWFIVNPAIGATGFVTAWLVIGLTVGFGQTLATDMQPKVVGPLGVLRRERQVSLFSAAAAFPLLALGFSATWGAWPGIVAALVYCLIVGETVACALWRRYLAMIIASAFVLPPDPAHCLMRMHALGHLRIAGVAYQFRHDDVLRYFAHRDGLRPRRPRAVLLAEPGQP